MVSKAEISNGDVIAVIASFQIKQESDIGFYMKYSIDDENRLHNLFWADAISLSDYACFRMLWLLTQLIRRTHMIDH